MYGNPKRWRSAVFRAEQHLEFDEPANVMKSFYEWVNSATNGKAVFMEVHDNPAKAPSDGPNQLPLKRLEKLLIKLKAIHELVNDSE